MQLFKYNLFFPFISLFLIFGVSSCKKKKTKEYKYPGFGITVPGNFSIHGIDISRHQEHIDWSAVKAMRSDGKHISFVYIKATEGTDWEDEHFDNNWNAAGRSGLLRGSYHFFLPSKDPLAQAYYFQQVVKLKSGDLPPVIDIEITEGMNAADIRKNLSIFIHETERHYRVKPVIYTSYKYFTDYLHGYFDGYPIWIAHYKKKSLKLPEGVNWAFWQHSEKGRVNGIKGKVDFNVFNGDVIRLRSLCVK